MPNQTKGCINVTFSFLPIQVFRTYKNADRYPNLPLRLVTVGWVYLMIWGWWPIWQLEGWNVRDMQKYIIWLVVRTPLKNISQMGWLFPKYGKIKHVPNHQPVIVYVLITQIQFLIAKLLSPGSVWKLRYPPGIAWADSSDLTAHPEAFTTGIGLKLPPECQLMKLMLIILCLKSYHWQFTMIYFR